MNRESYMRDRGAARTSNYNQYRSSGVNNRGGGGMNRGGGGGARRR